MLDALRVQKTISYYKSKITRSMYQRALLTTIAIRLEIYVDEVVQVRDKFGSNFQREKKSISTDCRSDLFDTTNYLYEHKIATATNYEVEERNSSRTNL